MLIRTIAIAFAMAIGAIPALPVDLPTQAAVSKPPEALPFGVTPLPASLPSSPEQLPPPINPDDRHSHGRACRDTCVQWDWYCHQAAHGRRCRKSRCLQHECVR